MAGSRKTPRSTRSKARAAPPAAAAREDLSEIRERIDAVDASIQALLNERARYAQLVGISKSATGRAVDFYRPEREAQVLRMALARNQGPLRDEEIARTISRASRCSRLRTKDWSILILSKGKLWR